MCLSDNDNEWHREMKIGTYFKSRVNQPREKGGLGPMNLPLLADKNQSVSKAYGVLKEDDGVPFRGLFIIDGNSKLRQITVNDLPVGRDVDETIRLVQAFQFTDKHGEVCPAGWKPGLDLKQTFFPISDDLLKFIISGKKTMKPDHQGVAKYLTDNKWSSVSNITNQTKPPSH